MQPSIALRLCVGLGLIAAVSSGCASVPPGHTKAMLPPVVPESIPRELSKVSLPDYVIEPPDILTIDAVNIVPLPPYHLNSLDTVMINVAGTLPDQPIQGEYAIEPGGIVNLGFTYGAVQVSGLTIEEAKAKVVEHLRATITEPEVWLSLARIQGQQEIAGEHLVAPDGKVNLGTYGRVRVVGMTIEQARAAIEAHLSQFLENPKVAVDVFAYNSKVYYLITQGAGLGDQAYAVPVMGNETALDAITRINGFTSVSSKRIWIARPGPNGHGGDQVLPIDWLAITQRGDVSTNYQILPGDRIFVAEDKLVALDNGLAKLIAPVERIFGFTLLGTSTVQRLRFFNRYTGNFGP